MKTGHYVLDEQTRKLVRVSDRPLYFQSALSSDAAWFPGPYFDKMAARRFESKAQKKAWMKEKGVKEVGASWQNPLKGLAESRARDKKLFA